MHIKSYFCTEVKTSLGTVIVEGPISSELLETYNFHDGLVAFRPPEQQKQALVKIAKREEGRIIIARNEQTVIGYVTYLHPDPLERWSQDPMENLIVLGAIEIASDYRGYGIATTLLDISFMADEMEDYLVITTEYYWHWDLKGSGLNVWQYRKMLEQIMKSQGFEYYSTDDPEITSHPANCLMARIGSRVDQETIERFNNLRFKNRSMDLVRGNSY